MKTTLDRELWRAIEAFDIDGGPSALSFEARLARENGWTREFAAKVVGEYRRFVYLAANAGHPVTPSDEVDQAWHLHITYTRSYWDRLCGEVLGKPLHHDPTRGGRSEGAKFEDWYAKTRETYGKVFGHEPPPDVWPDASTRFGDASHFARINTTQFWMIRKPRSWRKPALAAAAVGLVGTMAGCVATLSAFQLEPILLIAGLVLVFAVLIGYAIKSARHGTTGRQDGSGCGGGFFWWGGSGCGSSCDHGDGSSGAAGCAAGGGSGDGGSSGCGSSGCGGGGCGGGCGS